MSAAAAVVADAADQLDFPPPAARNVIDPGDDLSTDLPPPPPRQEGDEDFDAFTQSAQSLEFQKETKDGNIVVATGRITPEASDVKHEANVAEKAPEAVTANGVSPPRTVSEQVQEPPTENATATDDATKQVENGNKAEQAHTIPEEEKTHRFVTPKDFSLLKVIGMGAFGKVLQVKHKKTERILAMKVISKRLLRKGSGYVENVQAERKILTRVRSPFVVTMHCSFQTREKLFIVMDFLAGGELFLRLGREGIFLEKQAAFYLGEILLALDHLHTLGILHRDLKPENILLGEDGHVCVTDFGLAKDLSDSGGFQNEDGDESRATTICGTMEYMAPEMLSRQGYGRAADYWSLGCIAYEMLNGLPPFSSKRGGRKELFTQIMSSKVKMPPGSTAAACKLLKGLLNRNVQARLGTTRSTMFEVGGVAALKKLEFFKVIDWEKLERKEMEPPHVFSVTGDQDVQHFHEEFTGMALPRSVVEMAKDDFQPRRVDSEAFRGFSFIQSDFEIPDRDASEIRSYWDSIREADGESASECASSKLDTDEVLPEPIPEKKKRPPRKRKKKKKADAASTGTPAQSTNNTPVPSENGDDPVKDTTQEKAKPLHADAGALTSSNSKPPQPVGETPKVTESAQEGLPASATPLRNNNKPPGEPSPATQKVAESPQNRVPVTTPLRANKPPVEDAWQDVSTSPKKKKGTNRSTPPARSFPRTQDRVGPYAGTNNAQQQRGQFTPKTTPNRGFNQQDRVLPQQQQQQRAGWGHTRPVAQQQQQVSSRPTPWSQKRNQGGAAWGRPSPPPAPVPAPPPPLQREPSSDWREHAMSPRSAATAKRILDNKPSSFPSLGTLDPPLNPKAKPVATKKLQGAWASRTKS